MFVLQRIPIKQGLFLLPLSDVSGAFCIISRKDLSNNKKYCICLMLHRVPRGEVNKDVTCPEPLFLLDL